MPERRFDLDGIVWTTPWKRWTFGTSGRRSIEGRRRMTALLPLLLLPAGGIAWNETIHAIDAIDAIASIAGIGSRSRRRRS